MKIKAPKKVRGILLLACLALASWAGGSAPGFAATPGPSISVKIAPPPSLSRTNATQPAPVRPVQPASEPEQASGQPGPELDATKPAPAPVRADSDFGRETRAESPSFSWSGYFKAIGTLFLILAALWYAVWHLRRKGALPGISRTALPRDALRIEGSLSIGPRKGLLVVRFLNHRLLLGVTDQRITLLTELKDHETSDTGPDGRNAADPGSPRERQNIDFASVMRELEKKPPQE